MHPANYDIASSYIWSFAAIFHLDTLEDSANLSLSSFISVNFDHASNSALDLVIDGTF